MTLQQSRVVATDGYIYTAREYPHVNRALNTALAAAYQARYWVQTARRGKRFDLECGWRRRIRVAVKRPRMLESREGKRGEIRSARA